MGSNRHQGAVEDEVEVKTAVEQDIICYAPSSLLFLTPSYSEPHHSDRKRGKGRCQLEKHPEWYRWTAECRNPWSCRNKKELIQRARHVGHHPEDTMYTIRQSTEVHLVMQHRETLSISDLGDPFAVSVIVQAMTRPGACKVILLFRQNCRTRPRQRRRPSRTHCIPSLLG